MGSRLEVLLRRCFIDTRSLRGRGHCCGGEHEFEKHSPLGYVLRAVIQTMFVRDTYLYEPFFREGTQVSSSCCPHAADVPNLSQ